MSKSFYSRLYFVHKILNTIKMSLPDDVKIYNIAKYLSMDDIITYCQSSKSSLSWCRNENLWKLLYHIHYQSFNNDLRLSNYIDNYVKKYKHTPSWYHIVKLFYFNEFDNLFPSRKRYEKTNKILCNDNNLHEEFITRPVSTFLYTDMPSRPLQDEDNYDLDY